MPREFSRASRIADLIQHEVAVLIQREIELPQGGMITVSAVRVTPDLSHAKIFFTILGEADTAKVTAMLNDAAPHLRHLLGKRVTLKKLPRLHFTFDASVVDGARLSALIDEAVKSDRQHARDTDEPEDGSE